MTLPLQGINFNKWSPFFIIIIPDPIYHAGGIWGELWQDADCYRLWFLCCGQACHSALGSLKSDPAQLCKSNQFLSEAKALRHFSTRVLSWDHHPSLSPVRPSCPISFREKPRFCERRREGPYGKVGQSLGRINGREVERTDLGSIFRKGSMVQKGYCLVAEYPRDVL